MAAHAASNMDDLLWREFTTQGQPSLREQREEALGIYKRMLPTDPCLKRFWLESVRLLTHFYNVDAANYHASLARLKTAALEALEDCEARLAGGRRHEVAHVPNDKGKPLVDAGLLNEGFYLQRAGGLKKRIEWFEKNVEAVEALCKIQARRNLQRQGITPPPPDLSVYQKPPPTQGKGKGKKGV